MTKFKSLFSWQKLRSLAIVFIAGALLWVSTACSQSPNADMNEADSVSQKRTSNNGQPGQLMDNYDEVQPRTGGMNQYEDVDPRRATSDVKGRVNNLLDEVDRKAAQNDGLAESVTAAVEDAPLTNAAEEATGTNNLTGKRAGISNNKDNSKTEAAINRAKANLSDTAENADQLARESVSRTQRTAERAGDYMQEKAANAADSLDS
ncbi:hypothetical protein IQ241_13180 [Romeria aff. gracilis LEGE 07310]|uniref:Late embryogenesis abundant protein n=1 Tax=Vasconcelosia minhoensis LEGE 07310 TaxID=915328 RepID=A0A8J7DD04_9CYAN|nr:hypothetical protein [Romeria gracilis]MBE9078233.1 hypothetical protein [Romeria aff. gracilis LEGE 07310]